MYGIIVLVVPYRVGLYLHVNMHGNDVIYKHWHVKMKSCCRSSSNTLQFSEYYRTIAHTGCDNKGARHIYRCKLKTVWWCDYGILQLSTLCLKASKEELSTNGCERLFHILMLSVEVLAYGTMNRAMWPLATDDVVCTGSSSGGTSSSFFCIATRPFTILYIITALHLVHLSANGCHCSVFSIV